jgi:hypothetical protein
MLHERLKGGVVVDIEEPCFLLCQPGLSELCDRGQLTHRVGAGSASLPMLQ